MPCPFQIFSQSDYLIQIISINSHAQRQTVQIQISWLLQKPTDMDLHCLQRRGISGFSRTRVKMPWPLLIFSGSDYLIQVVDKNSHTYGQTVQIQMLGAASMWLSCLVALKIWKASVQMLTSSEANWSGSKLFAKVGYIRVQQDQV